MTSHLNVLKKVPLLPQISIQYFPVSILLISLHMGGIFLVTPLPPPIIKMVQASRVLKVVNLLPRERTAPYTKEGSHTHVANVENVLSGKEILFHI